MKKKKKRWVIFIVVILLLSLASVSLLQKLLPEKKASVSNVPAIPINYTNLEKELSKAGIVKAIPEEAILLLKFYNFDSGERTFEKAYTLERGEVKEIENYEDKADIVLLLHSKYLAELTNKNFCSIIKKANKAGDLGFETDLSKTALAWKFKSLYEYRDCLGF